MITLISKWKLKNGCPADLVAALRELAHRVGEEEPGTRMYLVNVEATGPLGPGGQPLQPPPAPIPASEQTEIVFMEAYRDTDAFEAHVNGPLFTAFREANLKYFYEDPNSPGWANTDTLFYRREATVLRTGDPTDAATPTS